MPVGYHFGSIRQCYSIIVQCERCSMMFDTVDCSEKFKYFLSRQIFLAHWIEWPNSTRIERNRRPQQRQPTNTRNRQRHNHEMIKWLTHTQTHRPRVSVDKATGRSMQTDNDTQLARWINEHSVWGENNWISNGQNGENVYSKGSFIQNWRHFRVKTSRLWDHHPFYHDYYVLRSEVPALDPWNCALLSRTKCLITHVARWPTTEPNKHSIWANFGRIKIPHCLSQPLWPLMRSHRQTDRTKQFQPNKSLKIIFHTIRAAKWITKPNRLWSKIRHHWLCVRRVNWFNRTKKCLDCCGCCDKARQGKANRIRYIEIQMDAFGCGDAFLWCIHRIAHRCMFVAATPTE